VDAPRSGMGEKLSKRSADSLASASALVESPLTVYLPRSFCASTRKMRKRVLVGEKGEKNLFFPAPF